MKTYIKGNFRKSIFRSDKGYVIGIFKVRDTNDEAMKDYINKTITFTGYFHELNEDDTYLFYGEEVEHPRYGYQFQVNDYERVKPEGKDGVIEFLTSDLFPGIGEKQAKLIVDTLGEKALDKILEDPSCLSLVPKLSSKKADKIYHILEKYEESHKMIVYLSDLGFSMKDALSIYNTYRSHTMEYLEHNIFRLIDDVDEITFLKIDRLREKLNIDAHDERRLKACLYYVMEQLTFARGDTYLELLDIYRGMNDYLHEELDSDLFDSIFQELIDEEKIVLEEDSVYLKEIYDAENRVVEKIRGLLSMPPTKYKKLDTVLKSLEEHSGIVYNEQQERAIRSALENNLLIITGGPGTGKTTIIKAIVDLYQHLNGWKTDELMEHLALLAPTGRASKRMSESTYLPASTIHRFLKWNKDNNEFAINEWNKAQNDFIIVDEVSMIDLPLLDHLLKGLNHHIKLILVGDYNQLPSVGPGQVLKDFIESGAIETIHLDLLYRQDENSYIPTLAREIEENHLSPSFLETKSDYTFLQCSSEHLRHNLKNLCHQLVEKGYDEKRVQIMAPMYRGENGIDQLNQELQEVFNPRSDTKRELKYGEVIFREKDKVLQLVNMPDENVFNGDVGVISQIVSGTRSKTGKTEIYVDFDGNVVRYQSKDFPKLKHGFVITIHKSQGSEFELVVMPMSHTYHRMLYRKLVYTGITRAKRKLILLGEPQAFQKAVQNNGEYIRRTNLKNKLKTMYNETIRG